MAAAQKGKRVNIYPAGTNLNDADKMLYTDSQDLDANGNPKTKNILVSILKTIFGGGGGSSGNLVFKSASHVITNGDGDEFIIFAGLSADVTCTLPNPLNNNARKLMIKNIDPTYDVIVGGHPIDGAGTKTLGINDDWLYVICDGAAAYHIFSADYKVNGIWYYEALLTSVINLNPVATFITILSYTIPEDGIWEIKLHGVVQVSQSDRIYMIVFQNGSNQLISTFNSMNYSPQSDYTLTLGSAIRQLNKGDLIEWKVYSYFGGGTSNVVGFTPSKGTGWDFTLLRKT